MEILSFFEEKTFYPYQKESILNVYDAFNNGTDTVILEAAWGIGKTVIAKTFANFFKKTFWLTASIGLQNQILTKFPDTKKVDGRSNHLCLINPKVKCNKAECSIPTKDTELKCIHKPLRIENVLKYNSEDLCSYWKQKTDAIQAKISCHNYDYYLTEVNHVGDFIYPRNYKPNQELSDLSLGIFDEGHNIGAKILKHFQINIKKIFMSSVGIPFPNMGIDRDKWIGWLHNLNSVDVPENIIQIKTLYEKSSNTGEKELLLKKLDDLSNLSKKISFLLSVYEVNKNIWIFNPIPANDSTMIELKIMPIIVSPFVENRLFKNFDKKIIMSSTILNPSILVDDLGLKRAPNTMRKIDYISVPSPFPLENRPIYPMNIGDMGYGSYKDNLPALIKAVEMIMDLFPEKKGLIHSNSFDLNNYVLDHISRDKAYRIVSHRGGSNKKGYRDALYEHFEDDNPTVISSPSLIEGVDFPGKYSEFQIIYKLFYDNTMDNPQLSARRSIDPAYYEWLACVKTIQATGRSNRSMTDKCPTFYLDSRFLYFVSKNKDLLANSRWWTNAIVREKPHKYSYIAEESRNG